MTETKDQGYQILRTVKIGSEYYAPEAGEALFMDLSDKVGQSLVEQGAAQLVVKKTVKVAEPKSDKK